MVDIKKILELCVKDEICETLDQLYGLYLIEDLAYAHKDSPIFDKTEEAFNELKRLIPIWKENYNIDGETSLTEILQKIS